MRKMIVVGAISKQIAHGSSGILLVDRSIHLLADHEPAEKIRDITRYGAGTMQFTKGHCFLDLASAAAPSEALQHFCEEAHVVAVLRVLIAKAEHDGGRTRASRRP